ncbi:recombinase family protein [Neobacillus niacini]|uniref:recombinase family protein n=1 Tax=Neobacillus niacini TaxID=86668 RepID=UPI0037C8D20F
MNKRDTALTSSKRLSPQSTWNRPESAKMLEGIIQGKYSRVLVTHPDRLSRDERDSAELKEIFIEHGIY